MYSLGDSLPFLLNRAGVAMGAAFSEELRQYGLTLPTWRILAALWSGGELNLTGLAEAASVEISTLSRQVGGLVEKGFIERRASGLDWRSVNLTLTSTGRELVAHLLPSVKRHEDAALSGVRDSDKRLLKQVLVRIYVNLAKWDEVRSPDSTDDKS